MPKQTIRHGVKFSLSLIVLVFFSFVIVDANKLSKTGSSIYVNPMFVQQTDLEQGYIDVSNVSIALDENNRGILKYVVQPGDSLYGIASKFGTTVSLVKKVNNIHAPIRPNTVLFISQDEGLLYVVKNTINVKLFAEKYDLNLQDVMSLNSISDESEILQKNTELFLNISKEKSYDVGLFPRPKPIIIQPKKYRKPVITKTNPVRPVITNVSRNVTSQARTQSSSSRQPKRKSKILAKWTFNKKISNGFYGGFCTWYVAAISPEIFAYTSESRQKTPFRGHAKQWYDNAASAGYRVGSVPVPGSIVVYSRTSGVYAAYGHVAKVVSHNPAEGTMVVEEMNYLGKYIVTRRLENISNPKIRGYIYP